MVEDEILTFYRRIINAYTTTEEINLVVTRICDRFQNTAFYSFWEG